MVRPDFSIFPCAHESQASVTTRDALRSSEWNDEDVFSCTTDTLRGEIEKAQIRAARFVEFDLDDAYWRTLKRQAPREWIRQRRAMNIERAAIQRQGQALHRRLQQISNALRFEAIAKHRQHGADSSSTLNACDTVEKNPTHLPTNKTPRHEPRTKQSGS